MLEKKNNQLDRNIREACRRNTGDLDEGGR